MLQKEYPLYLANRPDQPNTDLAVTHKFSGETATRVAQADAALVDRAIAAAVEAAGPMAALDQVNDSAYGIHAGVFTPRIDHAMQAWDRLDVGGVLINEVPSWRVDNLPYGGVKDSGLGREGVRYAMDDMTEIRSLVIRDIEPKAARADTRPPRKTSIARARRANVPVSRETEKRRHIA